MYKTRHLMKQKAYTRDHFPPLALPCCLFCFAPNIRCLFSHFPTWIRFKVHTLPIYLGRQCNRIRNAKICHLADDLLVLSRGTKFAFVWCAWKLIPAAAMLLMKREGLTFVPRAGRVSYNILQTRFKLMNHNRFNPITASQNSRNYLMYFINAGRVVFVSL